MSKDKLDYFVSELQKENPLTLPAMSGLRASYHSFESEVIDAIVTAYAIQRPLLIKGDPGLGKSQIAHAIATALNWNLLVHVVHSRTEPTDLLYHMDHVQRLAKAQILGAVGGLKLSAEAHGVTHQEAPIEERSKQKIKALIQELEHQHFVVPGPIWWAYNAQSAREFYQSSENYQSKLIEEIKADRPSVLLIDEIDKADSELPNALLEILNNQSFHVASQDRTIEVDSNNPPFVVITSNDERELPHAFLRRCVVLTLSLQEGEKGIKQLIDIAAAHENDLGNVDTSVRERIAREVLDRRSSMGPEQYKPGTSEYLDVLKTLNSGVFKDRELDDILEVVNPFILHK